MILKNHFIANIDSALDINLDIFIYHLYPLQQYPAKRAPPIAWSSDWPDKKDTLLAALQQIHRQKGRKTIESDNGPIWKLVTTKNNNGSCTDEDDGKGTSKASEQ